MRNAFILNLAKIIIMNLEADLCEACIFLFLIGVQISLYAYYQVLCAT